MVDDLGFIFSIMEPSGVLSLSDLFFFPLAMMALKRKKMSCDFVLCTKVNCASLSVLKKMGRKRKKKRRKVSQIQLLKRAC
jgi:hypothetical protein